MTPRRWRIVELSMIMVVAAPCIIQGTFVLELLNASTMEENAVKIAVDTINKELAANGSSFILQSRNALKQLDLYHYTSYLLSNNVIALLDFNVLPYYGCTISTVTKIPVFRFHGSESYKMNANCSLIVMSADYASFAQASIQILDTFKWKKIALMIENSRFYEAVFFEAFTSYKDYTLNYIQLFRDDKDTQKEECSCERAMKGLAASGSDVILLFAREKSSILSSKGCNHKKTFVWIIQDSDSLDVISARNSHMVVGFGLPTQNGTKWSIKGNTFGLAYDAVMLIAMTLKRMHDNEEWLPGNSIATSFSNKRIFYKRIKQMSINGHTSTVKFDAKGRRVVDELRILNLVNNTFTEIGQWSKPGNILTLPDRIHFNDALLDGNILKGRQITVVTALSEPFIKPPVRGESKATYHGFCVDILNEIASQLKFTYKIKLVDDGFYGALVNGKWNGMIQEILDGRADMIVAPLTRNLERQRYVAMTASFMYYTDKLIMKETVFTEEKELFQFMSPFSVSVWLVMAAILVIVALAMFILNYLSPYGCKKKEDTKTSEEFNLLNSIWFSAACMLQQGADHSPKALSGRILAGFFWFSILVWVSTYTANLVAFFTVEMFVRPVTNFQEAVESRYDLGVVSQSNLHSLFSTSEYDLYKRAWNRMKKLPKNISQALEWVREEEYIHILDGPVLDYIAEKKPCDLFVVQGLQSPRSYAFALRQNDPHVQEISLAILHLRENGFIENLRHQYWNGLNECPNKNTNRLKNKTIQLDSMTGMFIVLGMGFLISLLTLAIEIYWHRAGGQRLYSLKERTTNNFKRKRPPQRIVVAECNEAITEESLDTTIPRSISAWTS